MTNSSQFYIDEHYSEMMPQCLGPVFVQNGEDEDPKMLFLDPIKLLTCCQLTYLFAKLSTRRCLSVTFTFLGFCCPVLLILKCVAAVKFKMR